MNLILLALLLLGIDPPPTPSPETTRILVTGDGQVVCPDHFMALEVIVGIPYEGVVICAPHTRTNVTVGKYYAYEIKGIHAISAVADHPLCGERAYKDLRWIVFPALADGSKKYNDMIKLIQDDMHEACHIYWLDQTGW